MPTRFYLPSTGASAVNPSFSTGSKMKKLLLILAMVASSAYPAPTLNADALPATGPQPSTATITVNGGAGPVCSLPKAADGSVQLTCDLATLAVPGTYTIVATYTYVAGCVNSADAATCQNGGVASSAPFALTRVASPVAGPRLRVSP
jgi:hypothetical protein